MDTPSVSPTVRIVAFFGILAVATLGLMFVYRLMPSQEEMNVIRETAPIQEQTPAWKLNPERVACESAHGLWTECGDSCRGTASSTCVSVCERQCVCGGINRWGCPSDLLCGRKADLVGLGLVGVCGKTDLSLTTSTQEQISTSSTSRQVFSTPPGMMCGTDGVLCGKTSWKESTFTWPLKLTGIIQGEVKEAYWSMVNARGLMATGSLMIAQKNASTTIWTLNAPRPSGWRGTSRINLSLDQDPSTHATSSVSFDIFVK